MESCGDFSSRIFHASRSISITGEHERSKSREKTSLHRSTRMENLTQNHPLWDRSLCGSSTQLHSSLPVMLCLLCFAGCVLVFRSPVLELGLGQFCVAISGTHLTRCCCHSEVSRSLTSWLLLLHSREEPECKANTEHYCARMQKWNSFFWWINNVVWIDSRKEGRWGCNYWALFMSTTEMNQD